MTARIKLLKCQKLLNRQIQRSAKLYVGNPPPFIRKYSSEYEKELKRHKKLVNKNRLLDEVLNSQLVLCGDYHTLSQAQRTVIRILRDILPRLKKEKKTIYLALEIFKASDSIRIQQLLKKEISEDTFLKAISFDKRGFNWENYSPLIELARQWQISVVGLSPDNERSLQSRDQYGAELLANWSAQSPEAFVIAMMGDLHLASNHLPGALKLALAKKAIKRKTLVVHQNHDPLYWKIAKTPISEKGGILELKKGVYCIFNTPPWLKLKSHLNDVGSENEPIDEIQECVKGISYFLGISRKRLGRGEDVHISQTDEEPSFFLPSNRTFYLHQPNLNQLASLASQYVHSKLSDYKEEPPFGSSGFYVTIWREALGYYGSKIINPNRKCVGVNDLAFSKEPSHQLAFEHLSLERQYFKKGLAEFPDFCAERRLNSSSVSELAQVLGKILGEALFEMTLNNRISISTVRELFENRFEEDGQKLYLFWINQMDRFNVRHFSKKEKL